MKDVKFLTVLLLAISLCLVPEAQAQKPEQWTSAEIYEAIEKLGVLGSVMYVAAHPDDENTRLISYYANHVKAHTTYLSMTRGDGGQNLIGSEMRELLGVIRTHELLMARSVDGGEQMFTRANDFGYSKTPDETLEFWNKEQVLADVVWAIRKHRPDMIVTRFPHEHLNGNHGHHTASAMLAVEAFDLAADPEAFPGQLAHVDTWQPQRLFFKTSWWFYGSRERFAEADKTNMVTLDDGVYYPWLGMSNPEIAAQSRSMHKSQGFGSSGERGEVLEYLDLTKGSKPTHDTDPMSGIDITWGRVENAGHIPVMIDIVLEAFDFERPGNSIPALTELRRSLRDLPDSFWKTRKLEELDKIIVMCSGLFAEVSSGWAYAIPGDSVRISIEATNRSNADVVLRSVSYNDRELLAAPVSCENREPFILNEVIRIPDNAEYSGPYWLKTESTEGMYTVEDQLMRGMPTTPQSVLLDFEFEFREQVIRFSRPLTYKETDPVEGEVYYPFHLVPAAFIDFNEPNYIFVSEDPKPVEVTVRSSKDNLGGILRLDLPKGWSAVPDSQVVSIATKGDEETYLFELKPPTDQEVTTLRATLTEDSQVLDQQGIRIDYDHIPRQLIIKPARAKAVRVSLTKDGEKLAYIMGAGDDIPASLRQVGYEVDVLDEEEVSIEKLKEYDAIILGVRIYNTSERIPFYQDELFKYVQDGGTLITQYNTSRGLNTETVSPLPISLSRTRVTDEKSDVSFLNPDHDILHFPNEIKDEDFEGWVQERGLYFPGEWDSAFTPVLGMHDPGEEMTQGALLVARYGKGYFVYTGLSMFRQLPAGVPGAFRLFTNMISLGQESKS